MKKVLAKMVLGIVCLFMISACEAKSLTYLYLLRHPDVLATKSTHCTTEESPECQIVKRAARDFTLLNNERQENPELFGQKILLAQQELGKKQGKEYDEQVEHINAMLAIVALTSPE